MNTMLNFLTSMQSLFWHAFAKLTENCCKKSEKAVILFADLMNSTILADTLDNATYQRVISEFHNLANDTFNEVINTYKKEDFQKSHTNLTPLGDEIKLIIKDTAFGNDIKKALLCVLRFARLFKIGWLFSKHNQERIRAGKRPHDVGIGINVGSLTYDNGEPEGYHIILAKRVETSAREGLYTRIMLSRNAYQTAIEADARVYFTTDRMMPLKGFAEIEHVFEIKAYIGSIYWDPVKKLWKNLENLNVFAKLFSFDCFNAWLGIEIAIAYYYHMDFPKALSIINKVLFVDPQFALAFLLRGECYLNLATQEKQEDESEQDFLSNQAFFFRRAIDDATTAISIEKSEDTYIQRGIVYFFLALRQCKNEKPNTEMPKGSKLLALADIDFEKAMVTGKSSIRSVYWRWLVGEIVGEENRMHSLFCQAGWFKSSNENDIEIARTRIEDHLNVIFLPNYRAQVLTASGTFFSQIKEKGIAQKYLGRVDKCINELNWQSKTGKHTEIGIYSPSVEDAFLIKIGDFNNKLIQIKEVVESGDKLLPEILGLRKEFNEERAKLLGSS